MAVLIDAHKAIKQLTLGKAFSNAQAEKIVEIFSEAHEQLATKKDLELLEKSVTNKMYAGLIALAGFLVAAMKYI